MFSGQKLAARVLLCTWLLMCLPTLPMAGRAYAAEPSLASSSIRPTFGWSEIPVFVKWEGKNAVSYHIQYRIEGLTGWSDWLADTRETSGLFQPPNPRITSETMSGWRIYFRCRARDFAGRWEEWGNGPDSFVVIEKSAATSTVRATQQGSSPNILVSWSGNRATCYNIQYRDDRSFEWKEWLSSTRNLSAPFNGIPGRRYSFRCQARDQRGCWEAFCLNGSRDAWAQASAAPPPAHLTSPPPDLPPEGGGKKGEGGESRESRMAPRLSTSQTTVPRGTPARVGENGGARETAGSPPKPNVMVWRDMPSLHNPFVANPAQLGKSPSSAVSTLPPSPHLTAPPPDLPPKGGGKREASEAGLTSRLRGDARGGPGAELTRPASPTALAARDEQTAQAGSSADLLVDPKDYGSSRRGILFSNYLIIWGVVRNQGALEARDVDLVFYEDGKEFARKTIETLPPGGKALVAKRWSPLLEIEHRITIAVDPEKKTADSNRQNNILAFRVNPKGPLFLGRVENPSETPRQPVQKSEQELPKPETTVKSPAQPPAPTAAESPRPQTEQPKAEGAALPDLAVDQNNSGWGRNGGGLYSDAVAFWTSIVNRGRVTARDVVVTLYLNGKKLAEEVLEVLSPGSRALISKMAPAGKDQEQEIRVVIDEEGKIPDSDRANNTATFRAKRK